MFSCLTLALMAHAGTSDCNDDGILDQFQPCLDCDDNGLLDPCELTSPQGLVGQYWLSLDGDGSYSQRVLSRIDSTIAFDWSNDSPDPLLPDDNFSVRWTGAITPPTTGEYTFWTKTDDGVRLWVDGERIINQWSNQAPTTYSGTITLQANTPVLIRMDYYEAGGGAVAELEWRPPNLEREFIPASALAPSTDLNGDGWPEACTDCDGDFKMAALKDADTPNVLAHAAACKKDPVRKANAVRVIRCVIKSEPPCCGGSLVNNVGKPCC